MHEIRKEQILTYLEGWIDSEGLCRFCDTSRVCPWSRRGREYCEKYLFSREMDCFHLWIACFDHFDMSNYFREGYGHPDDYPFNESDFPFNEEEVDEITTNIEILDEKKVQLLKMIDKIENQQRELKNS